MVAIVSRIGAASPKLYPTERSIICKVSSATKLKYCGFATPEKLKISARATVKPLVE